MECQVDGEGGLLAGCIRVGGNPDGGSMEFGGLNMCVGGGGPRPPALIERTVPPCAGFWRFEGPAGGLHGPGFRNTGRFCWQWGQPRTKGTKCIDITGNSCTPTGERATFWAHWRGKPSGLAPSCWTGRRMESSERSGFGLIQVQTGMEEEGNTASAGGTTEGKEYEAI